MTTNISDDNMQILLIVILAGAILYMLTQRSGGICSLINPRERLTIGAACSCPSDFPYCGNVGGRPGYCLKNPQEDTDMGNDLIFGKDNKYKPRGSPPPWEYCKKRDDDPKKCKSEDQCGKPSDLASTFWSQFGSRDSRECDEDYKPPPDVPGRQWMPGQPLGAPAEYILATRALDLPPKPAPPEQASTSAESSHAPRRSSSWTSQPGAATSRRTKESSSNSRT